MKNQFKSRFENAVVILTGNAVPEDVAVNIICEGVYEVLRPEEIQSENFSQSTA